MPPVVSLCCIVRCWWRCRRAQFGRALTGHVGKKRFTEAFVTCALFIIVYYLSLFWQCVAGTVSAVLVIMPYHMWSTAREAESLMLKWFLVTFVTAFGGWLLNYAVVVGFVNLYQMAPYVANLLLPMFLTALESALDSLVSHGYLKWAKHGDQSEVTTGCILLIHSYAESARLVSMLVIAVQNDNYKFIETLVVCLISNIFVHRYWFAWALSLN